MDDMEVDTFPSSAEHGYISPSASLIDNPTLNLQEREELVAKMDERSHNEHWAVRMAAEKDPGELQMLFGSILFRLTNALAGTSLRNICILFMKRSEAVRAVEYSDLNELRHGVQLGLEHGDWDYLIAHRMYNFASGDLLLRQNSDTPSSAKSAKSYLHTRIKVCSPQSTQYTTILYYLKGGKGPAFRQNVSYGIPWRCRRVFCPWAQGLH
jgi:hypothetical protein